VVAAPAGREVYRGCGLPFLTDGERFLVVSESEQVGGKPITPIVNQKAGFPR